MTKAISDKQIDFTYTGVNRLGQRVAGDVVSKNRTFARAQLLKQGITVTRLKATPKPIFERKKRIKSLDIMIFLRQLATLIKAGVPLVDALEVVAESGDKLSLTLLILEVKSEVASGTAFAAALRRHPQHFDALLCALIESGEQSGALETMLDRIATHKEQTESLKAKIKKAIKYPIAVIIVALVVTLILLIYVVPVFADLFDAANSELPVFTQWVVHLSEVVRDWWLMLLILFTALPFVFIHYQKSSQKFRNALDKLWLKLPLVGPISHHAIVARFARTLSTTFAAGVPLIDALESTAGAANNHVFYDATQHIQADVATGQQLHAAMRATTLFPNMMIQMVRIGEESGQLEAMLDKVASYYEDEVNNAIDGLTSLIEPVIMVILGILIGGLVIAMYLPIFKMGTVIG